MAALTENLGSTARVKFGFIQRFPVAASKHIYRFATICMATAGANAGNVMPAYDDTDDSEKLVVMGYAMEEKNNSSGDNGDLTVRVRREGLLMRPFASVAATALGKLAIVDTDQDVKLYHEDYGNIVMGRILIVETNQVYVDLLDRPSRIASGAYD